jgi:hypothetical protein
MARALWVKTRAWLDIVTKLGVIAGGIFALVQYLDAKHEARIARTFALEDAMQKDEVGHAREVISTELRARLPEIARIRATEMPPETARVVHAKLIQAIVYQSRGGKGLGSELSTVLDRFDILQVCIEKGLCDKDTAQSFEGAYARTLLANFDPYIEEQQEGIPGYGNGLVRFVAALAEPRQP